MGIRGVRRLAVASLVCLGLAVSLPAASEDAAQTDTLEQAAGSLAKDLVDQLLRHTDTHGRKLALQPLEPGRFKGLDERGRQQLHDLLVRNLGSEIRKSYRLVNPGRFKDISRMLEDSGDSAWFERYIELLRGAEADISISCNAGAPSKGAIELTCSADTVEPFVNRGAARTLLRTDWLAGPVDPAWGLASVAEAIVRHTQGAGNLNTSVVDAQSGEETALSQSIAKRLLDEFHAKKRAWRGPRPVGGSQETKDYRARGEIERHEARFELRIELDSPEGVMETTFRESMHWTPELRRLASREGRQPPPQDGECGTDADIGKRKLKDGSILSDWVLYAKEERLKSRDYLKLMVEAKILLAEHCRWDAVSDIMDAAVSGLAEELGTAIERDARSGLERLERVEASAGRHLALLRLRARAHARLDGLREEELAYAEWLAAAPTDHPDRLDVLKARRRVQDQITIKGAEDALGLDGRRRSIVRRGLRVLGVAAGEGSAEFDAAFRILLRSWQTSNGHAGTGYMTADQMGILIAEGRAAEEREQDDAAFRQARTTDTSRAYAAYLARYPDSPHAPAAQGFLDAASVREAEENARKAAVTSEQLLALRAEERVLIERGLASWRAGGGAVDGEFDDAFRAVLRDWQEANGGRGAGYLTDEQSATLMALGRKAEADDTAFSRAKEVATASAYKAYLSNYPNGRYAAVAKQSLEAIRVREDDAAFARAKAEGTVESYASYLEAYPSGRHVVEAHRLRMEARRRAEAARAAEHEACPGIVGTYRKTMRDVSEYGYEHAFHDYLISRTKFENHWFVKWDDSKHEMILKNAFSDDIEQRADWIGWASCYLGTERLSGSKVRIFYYGGSAGTSVVVDQLSFVEYDTDTRKFDNNVGLIISPSSGISIDNCYANRESKSCRRAESWYEESGLEEAELRVEEATAERRRADDAAFSRAKTEGTVEGYESYLESTPLGRHVVEAQRLRAAAVEERKRGPEIGERFRDCAECPEMVVVSVGSYMMGSLWLESERGDHEGPAHRVTIPKPFAVGVYEVTRKEWSRFVKKTNYSMEDGCWIVEGGKWVMNSGRSWRNPGFPQGDGHPVVCVSWEDAQAYVQWLSRKTGDWYRLLSESEWEYVARAGTGSRYWWGDEVGRGRANCAGNPGCRSRWGGRQTAPIGSFSPNAFGLHDVHGNVSELVEDCLHESYAGAPADGSVWRSGGDCSYRMARGGSWVNLPKDIRSASRVGEPSKARSYNVGFRVTKVLE